MEPIIIGGVLYHHGILGQHWGHQNGPPYPLGEGDHSASEKRNAKRGVKTLSSYLKDKKKRKKQAKALEKARQKRKENLKAAEENKKLAADKEKILKSGSATDLMKYKGQLSAEEIRSAIERLDQERKLSQYSESEKVTAADKVDKIMEKVGKATDWAEKGIKFYNVVSKITNSVNGKEVLPQIMDARSMAELRKVKAEATRAERQAQGEWYDVQKKSKELDKLAESVSQTREQTRQAKEKTKQEKEVTNAMKNPTKSQWDWSAYSAQNGKRLPDNTNNNNNNNNNNNGGGGKKKKKKNKGGSN